MTVYDDSQLTQTVVVAPGRSVTWAGVVYLPSDVVTLPTAQAEALALAGFVVPPDSAATVILKPTTQALLGVTNVDDAILALLAMIERLPTGGGQSITGLGGLDLTSDSPGLTAVT